MKTIEILSQPPRLVVDLDYEYYLDIFKGNSLHKHFAFLLAGELLVLQQADQQLTQTCLEIRKCRLYTIQYITMYCRDYGD